MIFPLFSIFFILGIIGLAVDLYKGERISFGLIWNNFKYFGWTVIFFYVSLQFVLIMYQIEVLTGVISKIKSSLIGQVEWFLLSIGFLSIITFFMLRDFFGNKLCKEKGVEK